jgi:AcrR family transcriptional regulator
VPESLSTPRRAQKAARERPSKGDQREQALLTVAERLLDEGRFGEAPVGELAAESGISRAGFYFYFASKDALLASVIDRALDQFHERIIALMAPDDERAPAEALLAATRDAADLWWEHGTVLMAATNLGATLPEVYERTVENFAVVREPTLALLLRHGTVPEAQDPEQGRALVGALLWMMERNFYDCMRSNPTRAELDALAERLGRVWVRAFGLDA